MTSFLSLTVLLLALLFVNLSVLVSGAEVLAPLTTAQPGPMPTLPKPLVLTAKDQIKDDQKYDLPKVPQKDIDGQPVVLMNNVDDCPMGPAMRNLISDDVLPALVKLDKSQKDHGKYQWFAAGNWNYCHYRDGDRDWYGWKTGDQVHWILFRSGFFWWRDNYAERWVYFYQGYWWWQNAKPPVTTQVFMDDKHYHVCDANGVLGDDLWTTGVVQSITTPVAKPTPNATPGHHRGGHRGGGGGGGIGPGGLPAPPSSLDNSE
jgi:hypothetical protein